MATKAKESVGSATQKVHAILESVGDDWAKVVNAAVVLMGGNALNAGSGAGAGGGAGTGAPGAGSGSAAAYFAAKEPKGKIEALAVAARYREEHESVQTHTKEEFAAVFKAARRNFDTKKFSADINNAKAKGLFNKGADNTLAYNGQRYVDALPDRKAAKAALRAPRKKRKKAGK